MKEDSVPVFSSCLSTSTPRNDHLSSAFIVLLKLIKIYCLISTKMHTFHMLSFLTTFMPYLTWTFLCCFSQLIATTCFLEYILILVPVSPDSVLQVCLFFLIVLYLECLCFPKIKQSLTFASLCISPAFHLISGSRIPSL